MIPDTVDEDLKAQIWRRDEFTCALCGKTVPWPEVVIIHRKHTKDADIKDLDDLLTACAYCVEETKELEPSQKEKRRLKRLLHELMEYTDHSDIIFEEDYEEEVIRLSRKIESMKKDYTLVTDACQEKEKLAIVYKVKMDRALKDLENYKKRVDNDIILKVRERTKDLFLEMIQALDNIDRAIEQTKKEGDEKAVKNLKTGLLSIRKGLIRSLESNGVIILDPLEDPFDPKEHESVAIVDDKEKPNETVIEVHSLGFKLDDLVLRPARVVISKGGPKREGKEKFTDFDLDLGETIDEMEEMEEIEEPEGVLELGSGDVEDEVVVTKKTRKKTKKK